jgi:hypothetical protein
MSCPHFRKKSNSPDCSGFCLATAGRKVITSLLETSKFCSSEHFDDCPFYLDYIGTCTKEKFCNLISVIEPSNDLNG